MVQLREERLPSQMHKNFDASPLFPSETPTHTAFHPKAPYRQVFAQVLAVLPAVYLAYLYVGATPDSPPVRCMYALSLLPHNNPLSRRAYIPRARLFIYTWAERANPLASSDWRPRGKALEPIMKGNRSNAASR